MEEILLDDDGALPAGSFSTWLAGMQAALGGAAASDVPCGECTACCTSSQFIHVEPDETATLAHIPSALLFPAPRQPAGHVLMGYDEHGRCPMLVDGACSIYEHRPRTCRTYDCRVFPAAGVELGDDGRRGIARRARRWEFGFPAEIDETEHQAVRAAAAFVAAHRDELPVGAAPGGEAQHAVLAIRLHRAFLREDPATGRVGLVDPTLAEVGALLAPADGHPT